MGSIPGQVGTCAFVPLVSSGEWGDAAPVLYTMVAVILCAPGTVEKCKSVEKRHCLLDVQ